jgi:4-amino-4-deoxy-L-arabinose transferase-like glycosyltransferase
MKLFSKYKFGILLMLIFIFALTMRIARYCLDSRIEKDAVLYINMAKDWDAKGAKHAFDRNPRIPPLYIYLMMLGEKSGIGAEAAGVAISIIAGSLTVFSVFFIACALMDKKLALLAAFLAAIHPEFIRQSPEVMRDILFIFCFASSLAFFVQAISKKKVLLWAGGGFFAGLATLTRNEGLELILIPFVWAAVELIIHIINKKSSKDSPVVNEQEAAPNPIPVILGLIVALVVFSIFTFPAEWALKDTSSTWTVIDERIPKYINQIIN